MKNISQKQDANDLVKINEFEDNIYPLSTLYTYCFSRVIHRVLRFNLL